MEEKEIFADVLDENEKVIAVIKPNKKKYWAFFNWSVFWSLIWVLFFPVLTASLREEGGVSSGFDLHIFWIAGGVCLGLCVVLYFLSFFFAKLAYKKRYYAYTNKRILIRCGVIGVDYKILDYKLLGATSVTVGILDRMLGGKTGYLRFGSASSPIASVSSGGYSISGYTFSHVDLPYDLLREIKKTMNKEEKSDK